MKWFDKKNDVFQDGQSKGKEIDGSSVSEALRDNLSTPPPESRAETAHSTCSCVEEVEQGNYTFVDPLLEPGKAHVEEEYFDEVYTPLLPPPELNGPKWSCDENLIVFGFSQQGDTHIERETACQDRCVFRFVGTQSLLVCAIADGVGSCHFSDYGADTATRAALEYISGELEVQASQEGFLFCDDLNMGKLLRSAFKIALEKVEALAQEMVQLPYSFQSTLTVSIYDGHTLYFGHAGDDGIVVLCQDGSYEMVTSRQIGEEAGSLYPLQSEATWQFGKVVKPVAAFALMTDGVLDAIVGPMQLKNRVYWPFLEPAFFTLPDNSEELETICRKWYTYMQGPSYRNCVKDDLTFVVVTSKKIMRTVEKREFDINQWNSDTEAYQRSVYDALYPVSESVANTPSSNPSSALGSEPAEIPDNQKDKNATRETVDSSFLMNLQNEINHEK